MATLYTNGVFTALTPAQFNCCNLVPYPVAEPA